MELILELSSDYLSHDINTLKGYFRNRQIFTGLVFSFVKRIGKKHQ